MTNAPATMAPAPANRNQGRQDRTLFTANRKTLQNPAAMKNGSLETAPRHASKTMGSHQRTWPLRIILSAKKRNQRVNTRQKASSEAIPASKTIKGSARKKTRLHQAARSPTYCRASRKNGQSPVANRSSDTKLAHPYQVEPV